MNKLDTIKMTKKKMTETGTETTIYFEDGSYAEVYTPSEETLAKKHMPWVNGFQENSLEEEKIHRRSFYSGFYAARHRPDITEMEVSKWKWELWQKDFEDEIRMYGSEQQKALLENIK